jgi:prepilin peptidase CpaA
MPPTILNLVSFGLNPGILGFRHFGQGIAITTEQGSYRSSLGTPGGGKGAQGMQHWLAWWPTLIVLAVATFTDLRSRRIPNWLVLPFLLAGIVVSPLRMDWSGIRRGFWLPRDWSSIRQSFWPGTGHGFAWHGLEQSCAGLGLGFLLYGLLFWMGGMGAGDLKLCAAIGAWIGPMQLFIALVITSMAGGIMVIGWLAWRKLFRKLFLCAGDLAFGWKRRGMQSDPEPSLNELLKSWMPYVPAIAIGTFMSFFAG